MAETDQTEPEQYDGDAGIAGHLHRTEKALKQIQTEGTARCISTHAELREEIAAVEKTANLTLDTLHGPWTETGNPRPQRESRLGLVHIALSTRKWQFATAGAIIASVWLKGG